MVYHIALMFRPLGILIIMALLYRLRTISDLYWRPSLGILTDMVLLCRLSSWVDTLYTFWDNITHYKTKSVHFLGLMNSATKGLFRRGRIEFGGCITWRLNLSSWVDTLYTFWIILPTIKLEVYTFGCWWTQQLSSDWVLHRTCWWLVKGILEDY